MKMNRSMWPNLLAFFKEFFQEGAKSIVMQIPFLMLIFLLVLDHISGGQKSPRGGKLPQGGAPPPPVEESQFVDEMNSCISDKTFAELLKCFGTLKHSSNSTNISAESYQHFVSNPTKS